MRGLKLKLNLNSAGGQESGMSDFQLYIMREREAYLKSLNDNNTGAGYRIPEYHDPHPLSMSQLKGGNHPTSFNIGDSALGKRNVGLMNSALGRNSSSQGSLHYVSKNLSSPNSNNNI